MRSRWYFRGMLGVAISYRGHQRDVLGVRRSFCERSVSANLILGNLLDRGQWVSTALSAPLKDRLGMPIRDQALGLTSI